VLLVVRMKSKTHVKLNISLPAEVHAWCLQKLKEEQRKTRLGTVYLSNIIASAVQEMMQEETTHRISLNEDFSDPQPSPGDIIVQPHKASAGGSKIAKTRYPTKRQAKS